MAPVTATLERWRRERAREGQREKERMKTKELVEMKVQPQHESRNFLEVEVRFYCESDRTLLDAR